MQLRYGMLYILLILLFTKHIYIYMHDGYSNGSTALG